MKINRMILKLEKKYGATFDLRRYWNNKKQKLQWRFFSDDFIDDSLEKCLEKALKN